MGLRIAVSAWATVVAVAGVLVDARAAAQLDAGPRMRRDLVLARSTWRLDGAFVVDRYAIGGDGTGTETYTNTGIELGLAHGVTGSLEIGARAVPFTILPEPDYRDPWLYGLLRFADGDVEVGGLLAVRAPVESTARLAVVPAIAVLVHSEANVRFESGLYVPVVFWLGPAEYEPDTIVAVWVPVELTVVTASGLLLGGRSGLSLRGRDLDHVVVPIGAFAGYGRRGPTGGGFDVVASFDLHAVHLTPGLWVVGLTARGFLAD